MRSKIAPKFITIILNIADNIKINFTKLTQKIVSVYIQNQFVIINLHHFFSTRCVGIIVMWVYSTLLAHLLDTQHTPPIIFIVHSYKLGNAPEVRTANRNDENGFSVPFHVCKQRDYMKLVNRSNSSIFT